MKGLTWRGTARCHECNAPCTVSYHLTNERNIEVSCPTDWIIRTIGNDDSNRDMDHVDVVGDRYEVLCPEHVPQRRPR